MIEFCRTGNMSITLRVDSDGLVELQGAVASLATGHSLNVHARLDRGVISLKRCAKIVEARIRMSVGPETEFGASPAGEFLWELSPEDVDLFEARLQRAVETGYFHPAELFRVQVPKNKKLDYIYGEFLGSGDSGPSILNGNK